MKEPEEKSSVWRRIAYTVIVCVVVILLLTIMAPATAYRGIEWIQSQLSERSGETILIATASRTGAYYEIGEHLRTVLDSRDSLSLGVLESDGSMANLRALRDGDVDLALVQGGLSVYSNDIVALANIDREFAHIIVPVGSSIETFRDLAGKRVYVGPEQSGSADLAKTAFGALSFDPMPVLVNGPSADAATALDSGSAEAALFVYRLRAPAMDELLATERYRLVPIPEAASIAGFTTGCYADYIPHSIYGPNHELPPMRIGALSTLAVNMVVAARQDAAPGTVRAVLDALYSRSFRRVASMPHLDEEYGRSVDELPLHAAAQRFYSRNDPVTADSFEIASFFIAVFLFGASAYQYMLSRKHKRIAEKRRLAIIPYFESMVTFGNAVENSNDIDQLTDILHNMMAAQRRAESQWLDGHLDTEHMENLYSVYSTRTRNAFSKIIKLHIIEVKERQDELAEKLARIPTPSGDAPKPEAKPKPKPVKAIAAE